MLGVEPLAYLEDILLQLQLCGSAAPRRHWTICCPRCRLGHRDMGRSHRLRCLAGPRGMRLAYENQRRMRANKPREAVDWDGWAGAFGALRFARDV